MKYVEIRQAFIDFFKSKQHEYVASSSLIPHNDPTLMFTNAGMNQFKDVFLGADKRSYNRAVTIQKCLRAGGKHNDLENVGFTARHHTFFEMMGNFSFGDYFKEDAIKFAWEFLTKILGIPEERLYVTVFTTDDEAAEIWEKQIGVPKNKIYRYGEKDNFWRMGATGPCGPCSEIFYDHNPGGPNIPVDQDEDRFVEIWNLVFMQFFEDESGKQTPLPKPSVDTGAGIERIAAALQGFADNYQADVFQPLMQKTCDLAGIQNDWNELSKTGNLGSVKVMTDHSRTAAFLIGEGVLPSNEGSGYVLRRIMRRAIRYGRKLNDQTSMYPAVIEEVIKVMASHYPELNEKKDFILKAVKDEEKRFLQTLDKGSEILGEKIQELKKTGAKEVDGQTAFTLYDTYGFPFDLTEVMAREEGLSVDEKGFHAAMEGAKDKARKAHKSHNISSNEKHLAEWTQNIPATEFVGYDNLSLESDVIALSNGDNDIETLDGSGALAFSLTPFYAEGGGQVADHGKLFSDDKLVGRVTEVKKMNDVFIHFVELTTEVRKGDKLQLKVNNQERQSTANNHSATHLLNAALKKVLGDHVNQAGSLVNPQKLRFDFSHGQPVSSDEITAIEKMVNDQIALATSVSQEVMGQKEAIAKGATAMFGEKYGDEVRVISMGDQQDNKVFSMELCGGTHVSNTSEIQNFNVVSETGVAAGVRRIEALTGERANQYIKDLATENKDLQKRLKDFSGNNLSNKVFTIQNEVKALESQLKNKGTKPDQYQGETKAIENERDLAQENLRLSEQLKAKKPKIDDDSFRGGLTKRVDDLVSKLNNLKSQLEKRSSQTVSVDDILKGATEKDFNGEKGLALIAQVEISDRDYLSDVADKIRDKEQNIALVLIGEGEDGKPSPMIVAVSKSLKGIHAGKITKELCSIMDGKGGGRPDFAQGSVSNLDKLSTAKDKFFEMLDQ